MYIHVYMYIHSYMCIYNLNRFERIMFTNRTIDYQKKNSAPGKRNLDLSCWSEESKKLSKQCSLFLLSLATSKKLKICSYSIRQHSQDWEKYQTWPKSSVPESALQATGKKAINAQLWNLLDNIWPRGKDILNRAIVALMSWQQPIAF